MSFNIEINPKKTRIPYKLISIYSLTRYVKNIADTTDFCKVGIIGSQGTGKTNLAISLANTFTDLVGDDVIVIYMRGQYIVNFLKYIESMSILLKEFISPRKYIFLILDDFSYVLEQTDSETRNLVKHNYTKLRHILHRKKLISVMTIHYRRAVLPVLRDVFFIIYTHMNQEMLQQFKDNYNLQMYAKSYMKYITNYYFMKKAFIFDAHVNNDFITQQTYNNIHKIVDVVDSYEDEKQTLLISIKDKNERIAVLDSTIDSSFIYYRLMYNDEGLLECRNNYIVLSNYNEFLNVPKQNIIDINKYVNDESSSMVEPIPVPNNKSNEKDKREEFTSDELDEMPEYIELEEFHPNDGK